MKISNNQEQYKKAFKKTTTSAAEVCYTRKNMYAILLDFGRERILDVLAWLLMMMIQVQKRRKCIVHTFSVGDVDDGGIREWNDYSSCTLSWSFFCINIIYLRRYDTVCSTSTALVFFRHVTRQKTLEKKIQAKEEQGLMHVF